MNFTDLMVNTGVVQDALGGGGLTCVDVGHDTDVTGHLQRYISRRSHGLNLLRQLINNDSGKSLVASAILCVSSRFLTEPPTPLVRR